MIKFLKKLISVKTDSPKPVAGRKSYESVISRIHSSRFETGMIDTGFQSIKLYSDHLTKNHSK